MPEHLDWFEGSRTCVILAREKIKKKSWIVSNLNGLIGWICCRMCVVCVSLDRFMKPNQVIYIWTRNLIFFLRTFLWNRGYKCKKEARYMGGLFHRTLNKEPLVWRDWPICFQLSLCSINEYLPYVADFYFYYIVCYASYISGLYN